MPSVTITLTDTPEGGVCVASNYVPALGRSTSTAQIAALDIINRTCREYGLPNPLRTVTQALGGKLPPMAPPPERDSF